MNDTGTFRDDRVDVGYRRIPQFNCSYRFSHYMQILNVRFLEVIVKPNAQRNKKLKCRRETARRFVSLNILPSHSRLLNVIRNDAVE